MDFNKDEAVAKLRALGIDPSGLEDKDLKVICEAYDIGIEDWLKQGSSGPRDYDMIRAVFVALTDRLTRAEMRQATIDILKVYADDERNEKEEQ